MQRLLSVSSHIVLLVCLCFSIGICSPSRVNAEDKSTTTPSVSDDRDYRQPIDLVLSPDEKHIAVASHTKGILYILDSQSGAVTQSLPIATSLDDLEAGSQGTFFAVSSADKTISALQWNGGQVKLLHTSTTSTSPVKAEWNAKEKVVRVACLWARRLETFAVVSSESSSVELQKIASWDLDVAPRIFHSIPNHPLVMVTDRFGSQIEFISSETGRVVKRHSFFGFGVVGLDYNPLSNEVGIVYSAINDFAKTSEHDIHFGVLLANETRWISLDAFLNLTGEAVYKDSHVLPVGVPGNGAGELTSFSSNLQGASNQGRVAVTVGGTNQLAVASRDALSFRYVDVGKYPVASAMTTDGQKVFVANRFEDSISVVDLNRSKLVETFWIGKLRAFSDVEKGERLFHDGTLSHDRWMTCASCHIEGHTNGQLTDNLGDRTYGAPKRTLTLLGLHGTGPFSWQGHETRLQKQIQRSVQKTMQSYRQLDPDELDHLAAYCESLSAPPSVDEARGTTDDSLVAQGKALFEAKGCVKCHSMPNFTSANVYDVGLSDEKGGKLFNPPSLRGVSQRGPYYFHDNQAEGLRGVVHDFQHRLEKPLSESDEKALIAYLESL